jgi:hypothetical protein
LLATAVKIRRHRVSLPSHVSGSKGEAHLHSHIISFMNSP